MIVHPANQAVMSTKRVISIGLSLIFFIMICITTSCNSGKAVCDSNHLGKPPKLKKNKSNYGVVYEHKSKPVGKNYVVRNRR